MDIDITGKIYIALSIVVLYLFFKTATEWKKGLDRKKLSLMQLYLELKFLYKNLTYSTQASSGGNFCIELISSIKEYYNLNNTRVRRKPNKSFICKGAAHEMKNHNLFDNN